METKVSVELAVPRRLCGYSQEDVARKAGISVSKLSLFEQGFVELHADELNRVQKMLNKRRLKLENHLAPWIRAARDAAETGFDDVPDEPDGPWSLRRNQ